MMKNLLKKSLFFFTLTLFVSQLPAASIAVNPGVESPAKDGIAETPTINDYVKSFKELSKAEKKSRFKEVKKAIKEFRQQKKAGSDPSTSKLLIIIITILIPPLGVAIYEGAITSRFWISLLLTLLFYVPGLIYSLLVVTDSI